MSYLYILDLSCFVVLPVEVTAASPLACGACLWKLEKAATLDHQSHWAREAWGEASAS